MAKTGGELAGNWRGAGGQLAGNWRATGGEPFFSDFLVPNHNFTCFFGFSLENQEFSRKIKKNQEKSRKTRQINKKPKK